MTPTEITPKDLNRLVIENSANNGGKITATITIKYGRKELTGTIRGTMEQGDCFTAWFSGHGNISFNYSQHYREFINRNKSITIISFNF